MIPTPFWKPSGNPNILLWVPFTDATAKDISIYNRTPSLTVSGGAASIITNFFHINITSASPTVFDTSISYPMLPIPASFPAATPLTAEGFIQWVASPNNTDPAEMFTWLYDGSVSNIREWEQIYANLGNIAHSSTGGGVDGPTGTNPLTPAGTLYHWAWVWSHTDDIKHFYINGVQVLAVSAVKGNQALSNNPAFLIGYKARTNTTGPPAHTELYLGETRVSIGNLYPGGAPFTPPTPGNLPPVP